MKTSIKNNPSSVVINATFDAEDIEPARIKALGRLAKNVKVPGFRNGRAPANVVEQHVDPNALATETLNALIQSSVPKIFTEAKVQPISTPNVNVTKYVPGEMAEFEITADIMPEVKLGDYKKLKAKQEDNSIKGKDVEDVLNRIAESSAETKAVKRAAKKGDEVIIDFVGKKDGKAFEGGSAKNHKLVLGSGQFIPGFEDGIIGHEVGDKFNLDITFPKDYGIADLAGAKTVFEILVKQVNERTIPPIDDELAKKTGAFETLKDLKADIEKNLKAETERRSIDKFKDELIKELTEKSETALPTSVVEEQFNNIKQDLEQNLKSSGLTFPEFLKQSNKTEEEWNKEAHVAAENRVKSSLVINKLAEELKIKVSEEEFNQKVVELQHVYKNNEQISKQLATPEVQSDIRNRIRIDKTLDALVKLVSKKK